MNEIPPDALTWEELLEMQRRIVAATGGAAGLLHPEVLESALRRPYQAVFGRELYPTPFAKAAALAQTLAHDHPFRDGNNRTAALAVREFLRRAGYYLPLEEFVEETAAVLLDLATGRLDWPQFSEWLAGKARRVE
jgi:death-on-curing protein